MKCLVIYHSRTGRTKEYGEEINSYLQENGILSNVISIREFKNEQLENVDYVFLGCWTNGLMIFFQHPEKEWVAFARDLPNLGGKKIGFFTTYKIATGTMFRIMKMQVAYVNKNEELELKSKTGSLSDSDKDRLKNFIK